MDIKQALDMLNFSLKRLGARRSFIICGGASLILQGISRSTRVTKDVDVIAPEIDSILRGAAIDVSEELGISSKWLNEGPKSLSRDFKNGWEKRVEEVYSSTNLQVYSISRHDLIFTKFWAFCDRQKDLNDLIDLNLSESEIDEAAKHTKLMDSNPDWPEYVDQQTDYLKKRMGYG